MAKQRCCFAAPQSGAAERFAAFRHHVIIIDYIRINTQIKLITAHALPDNQASGKNLVKNGFQYLLTKTEDWGLGQPTVSDVYTYDC